MNVNNRGQGLRSVLVVVLCALFFLFAMGIALLGSGIYRDTVATADQNYTSRTALSYIVNQVRRGDIKNGVSVGSFGDSNAIFLRENGYVTILYCYEGQLCELFTEDGLEMGPQDGVTIMPLESFSLLNLGDGVLVVSLEDGVAPPTVRLSLRSGTLSQEVTP